MEKTQREYYLNEQLKAIQKELETVMMELMIMKSFLKKYIL